MILRIELPVDCELFVSSYDLAELVKVINPVKIYGVLPEDEANEASGFARIDFRVRQTTKQC